MNLSSHADESSLISDEPVLSSSTNSANSSDSQNGQLAVVKTYRNYDDLEGNSDDDDATFSFVHKNYIDYSWSRKILELIGNKAKLVESFSWLSTVGGGFSALGERDSQFSMKAGRLSLGQQLKLAELLGDERLKVMCHLFAALAALQLENEHFCFNYIRNVIVPMMNSLPYKDPILWNILRHICFRLRCISIRKPRYAIEEPNKK